MEPTPTNVIVLTCVFMCAYAFLMGVIIYFRHISFFVLKLLPLAPAKNPTTGNTADQRAREHLCRTFGCVTTARVHYPGMPQAVCCRCGKKTWCAQPDVKEWRKPEKNFPLT